MENKDINRLNFVLSLWVILITTVLCTCRLPRHFSNGHMVYESRTRYKKRYASDGYVLRFECEAGFILLGSNSIRCSSKVWTDKVPSCIKAESCTDPGTSPDGTREGKCCSVGDILRYSCNKGFRLQGKEEIQCLVGGKWSTPRPRCNCNEDSYEDETTELEMCKDPGTSSNGNREGKCCDIGDVLRYSCNDNFQLEGRREIQCLVGGKWSSPRPLCKRDVNSNEDNKDFYEDEMTELRTCLDPGTSPNGTREGKCCDIGDVLQYSCSDNFQLEGREEIQCLVGGNWSASRPLCRPFEDYCDFPPLIPHGKTEGDKKEDYYRPYDDVEVVCEPGFRYDGSKELVMCEDNEWKEEFGKCVEVFCDVPHPLSNGKIPEIAEKNVTSFEYNFELTYVCNDGFRLVGGDSWRFCDTKGWSGDTPHCEAIKCPYPGVPEKGSQVGSSFGIGDKVIFECFSGYELIGSLERHCLPNGQWSGELARCDTKDNYCPDPGIPINGLKSSNNYDMGAQIHFRCHAGFTLLGSETRECLSDETWSGEEVKCIGPHYFDNTASVSEILKTAITEKREEQRLKLEAYREASRLAAKYRTIDLTYPDRLMFYFAFDASGSVREHNFRKSVEFAKAIVRKVGISEDGARAGAITFSTVANISFLPQNYDTTQKVINALDELIYTGGGTAVNLVLSKIREVAIPLTNAYFENMKERKSIVFILTDGRANMGGEPEEEAKLLKDAGIEIYCIGITNSIAQDSLYKIASMPKEKHVFILRDYPSLEHLIQNLTKGGQDYSKCGLDPEETVKVRLRRIVGGRQTTKPWPWMAGIFETTKTEMLCSGSIIHERFILTAAHSLHDEYRDLKTSDELIVKLGLANTYPKANVQKFEVENIYIPIQTPIPEGLFSHDIALIKLKIPILFNAFVRPICLPPSELTVETILYKPRELAVAIGWGRTKVTQEYEKVKIVHQKHLKEVSLPIQSRERCINSLIARNKNVSSFTENMFCAGDGTGGKDACKGDSGGPIMQSQSSKEGLVYWTQVGIISWGQGCGLRNTFGFYTHVQRMLGWITETIRKEGT